MARCILTSVLKTVALKTESGLSSSLGTCCCVVGAPEEADCKLAISSDVFAPSILSWSRLAQHSLYVCGERVVTLRVCVADEIRFIFGMIESVPARCPRYLHASKHMCQYNLYVAKYVKA